MTSQPPNPELIGDLFWGIFRPQFSRIAIQIDVFSPLASGPASAEYVAEKCDCNPYGIKALLDYLCSLSILEKQDQNYLLTSTAETFLVPGNKAYTGDMITHYTDKALFDQILRVIQTGKPNWLGENFVQDAWLESYDRSRITKSLEMWRTAKILPDQTRSLRVLDIACGCGIKSLPLAQLSPRVKVTCLDAPEVLTVARDLAERLQVEDQVEYFPANLLQAELGDARYDAILLGQITYYWTEAQNRDLFDRIFRALSKPGNLVIDCAMSGEEPAEYPSLATLFLWANSGGTAYSFETYRHWLKKAGFVDVHRLGERWISATR